MTYHQFGKISVRVYGVGDAILHTKPHEPEINWPALGDQKIEVAEQFIKDMQEAINFAKGHRQ